MKNKKWLNYTLSTLLTLIVLTVVAGAGFRAGLTQNATLTRFKNSAHLSLAENDFDKTARNGFNKNDKSNFAPQNLRMQGMDGRRGDFGGWDGRFSFRTPIFGLIRILVLGALIWVGYIFIKKSGWRLSLSKTAPEHAAVSAANESTPNAEVEKDKEA